MLVKIELPKIIHAAIDSAYSALILRFKGLFPEPREGILNKKITFELLAASFGQVLKSLTAVSEENYLWMEILELS